MSGWPSFEGRLEPLEWGRATYTILRLPPGIAETLVARGARRVGGEISDHPVNLALSRAPVVEGLFLWIGRSLLDWLSVDPGEPLEIRFRPASPDEVKIPDDLALALRQAGVTDAWEASIAGRRRGLLHRIDSARTGPTRAKRIAAVVAELRGGAA